MHEVGIMREVLAVAERTANDAGCVAIALIVVRVGAFSGVVPEALEFAFEALHGEHPMTVGARLEIRPAPGVAYCGFCQKEFAVSEPIFECPGCGRLSGRLVHGRELDLLSVVATESDSPASKE
jgi:hydrogenase nickel incorporation protein HypA/HybF